MYQFLNQDYKLSIKQKYCKQKNLWDIVKGRKSFMALCAFFFQRDGKNIIYTIRNLRKAQISRTYTSSLFLSNFHLFVFLCCALKCIFGKLFQTTSMGLKNDQLIFQFIHWVICRIISFISPKCFFVLYLNLSPHEELFYF